MSADNGDEKPDCCDKEHQRDLDRAALLELTKRLTNLEATIHQRLLDIEESIRIQHREFNKIIASIARKLKD